jgi:hypothetical protein
MKFMLAIATAVAINVNTWAAHPASAAEHKVTVCTALEPSPQYLPYAELMASKMFAHIGVKLSWRLRNSCPAGDTIQIGVSLKTSATEHSGALGHALPYEGVHIVVFYDRIRHLANGDLRASLLAHVLVHEITHVLEGVDRHSETGVMKAVWTEADYAQMRANPLPFTDWDIQLIHKGLESRGRRLAAVDRAPQMPSQERVW